MDEFLTKYKDNKQLLPHYLEGVSMRVEQFFIERKPKEGIEYMEREFPLEHKERRKVNFAIRMKFAQSLCGRGMCGLAEHQLEVLIKAYKTFKQPEAAVTV